MRSLLRTPAFTIATVLTLAIGIGAATAIYSVVDTILFRPLPFPGGDRLVRLVEYGPHFREGQPPLQRGINYQEHQGWRDRAKTIEEAAAIIAMSQRMVKTPDGAAGLWGAMVSGNTFALLPTRPHLGRTLQPADDADPTVVVLSYDTWQRHYHSDPSIVGRTLEVRMGALLAARPPLFLTVVGVLPQDFEFPTGTLDFVMPIALDPSRPSPGVTTIARLAPDVSIEAATQEANAMGTAMRPAWPANKMPPSGPRFEYQSLKERLVAPLRPALRVILAAVAVLLLIVCANAANLLLARGTSRRREIAVRLAVGASRTQVFRQVLLECAVLAGSGGVLGALLGAAGVDLREAAGHGRCARHLPADVRREHSAASQRGQRRLAVVRDRLRDRHRDRGHVRTTAGASTVPRQSPAIDRLAWRRHVTRRIALAKRADACAADDGHGAAHRRSAADAQLHQAVDLQQGLRPRERARVQSALPRHLLDRAQGRDDRDAAHALSIESRCARRRLRASRPADRRRALRRQVRAARKDPRRRRSDGHPYAIRQRRVSHGDGGADPARTRFVAGGLRRRAGRDRHQSIRGPP